MGNNPIKLDVEPIDSATALKMLNDNTYDPSAAENQRGLTVQDLQQQLEVNGEEDQDEELFSGLEMLGSNEVRKSEVPGQFVKMKTILDRQAFQAGMDNEVTIFPACVDINKLSGSFNHLELYQAQQLVQQEAFDKSRTSKSKKSKYEQFELDKNKFRMGIPDRDKR